MFLFQFVGRLDFDFLNVGLADRGSERDIVFKFIKIFLLCSLILYSYTNCLF